MNVCQSEVSTIEKSRCKSPIKRKTMTQLNGDSQVNGPNQNSCSHPATVQSSDAQESDLSCQSEDTHNLKSRDSRSLNSESDSSESSKSTKYERQILSASNLQREQEKSFSSRGSLGEVINMVEIDLKSNESSPVRGLALIDHQERKMFKMQSEAEAAPTETRQSLQVYRDENRQARGFNQSETKLFVTSSRLRNYFDSISRRSRGESLRLYQFFKSTRTELLASLIFVVITSQTLITSRSQFTLSSVQALQASQTPPDTSRDRIEIDAESSFWTGDRASLTESLIPRGHNERLSVHLVGGLVMAFAVASLTQVFGHISGCHLIPSVSLALYIKGHIKCTRLAAYLVAQMLGSLLGVCLLALLTTSMLEAPDFRALSLPRFETPQQPPSVTEVSNTQPASLISKPEMEPQLSPARRRRRRNAAQETSQADTFEDSSPVLADDSPGSETLLLSIMKQLKRSDFNDQANEQPSFILRNLNGIPKEPDSVSKVDTSSAPKFPDVSDQVSPQAPVIISAVVAKTDNSTPMGSSMPNNEPHAPGPKLSVHIEDQGTHLTRAAGTKSERPEAGTSNGQWHDLVSLSTSADIVGPALDSTTPDEAASDQDHEKKLLLAQSVGGSQGSSGLASQNGEKLPTLSKNNPLIQPMKSQLADNNVGKLTRRVVRLRRRKRTKSQTKEVGEKVQELSPPISEPAFAGSSRPSYVLPLSLAGGRTSSEFQSTIKFDATSIKQANELQPKPELEVAERRQWIASREEAKKVGFGFGASRQSEFVEKPVNSTSRKRNLPRSVKLSWSAASALAELQFQREQRKLEIRYRLVSLNLLELALPDSIMFGDSPSDCFHHELNESDFKASFEVVGTGLKQETMMDVGGSSGQKWVQFVHQNRLQLTRNCLTLPNASQMFIFQLLASVLIVLAYLVNVDPRRVDTGFKSLSIGLSYFVASILTLIFLSWMSASGSWRAEWIVYLVLPLIAGLFGALTHEYFSDFTSVNNRDRLLQLRRSFYSLNNLESPNVLNAQPADEPISTAGNSGGVETVLSSSLSASKPLASGLNKPLSVTGRCLPVLEGARKHSIESIASSVLSMEPRGSEHAASRLIGSATLTRASSSSVSGLCPSVVVMDQSGSPTRFDQLKPSSTKRQPEIQAKQLPYRKQLQLEQQALARESDFDSNFLISRSPTRIY